MPLIPAPPGVATGFIQSTPARFQPPSTRNVHAIGFFEKGTVAQVTDAAALLDAMGGIVAYSPAIAELLTVLAEGADTITASRVTGPAAAPASASIDGKITVSATSPGSYANGWKVTNTAVGAARRLSVTTATDVPITTSPTYATVAELVAWAEADPDITVEIDAPGLPAATVAPVATAGGDDDRANVGPADYQAALDRIEARYGPGRVIAPGITDADVHAAIAVHCDRNRRRAYLTLPLEVTEGQALAHELEVYAAVPDAAWRVDFFATWAYTEPVIGDPQRLVSWAAVQAGISSRVEENEGVGKPPFGHRRGFATTVRRLAREWVSSQDPPGEVQRLYAGQINVAQDDGVTFALEGYRTADPAPGAEDGFAADTSMRLEHLVAVEGGEYDGEVVDDDTIASFAGRAHAVCEDFVKARAINDDGDPGFRVDTSMNTEATKASRNVWVGVRFRPAGSVHWVGVLLNPVRPTENL